MTTTEVNVTDEMMDFSLRRKTLRFRVDDDVFEAVAEIPVEVALAFADRAHVLENGTATVDQQVEVVRSLLRALLLPESAKRFLERLSDQRDPIGFQRFNQVVTWLFEEYGLRPTPSDSAFSPGSDNPASGTNLTVSTSDAGSTSDGSATTDSST